MNNNLKESTYSNNNDNSYITIKIILLLIILQGVRIIGKQISFAFITKNSLNEILISMGIMIILTIYIIYKGKRENISLNIFSFMKTKESKIYYLLVTLALLLLIVTSPLLQREVSIYTLIPLVYGIIIIPIYEEILFRSYIWGVLQKEHESEFKVYLLTTVYFALWQAGYIDTIIMRQGFNHIIFITFIRCSLMLSYGLFIGFFRYKIKNTYSSILIHGFINIFRRII